jgi:CMP-N-acetylneuraminic acid synthetase
MKTIALLPFKVNSERVPNKNFKSIGGKYLYKWMLEKLIMCHFIDEVIINTDADNLIDHDNIFSNDKVNIRKRRKEICGDHTSMNLVIEDDVKNSLGDIYIMTHTTNPLLSTDTINRAFELFLNKSTKLHECDSLFSVNRIQTRFYKKSGIPINHNPKDLARTQDLEAYYEENSNLYIFTKDSFNSSSSRIGINPYLFETPRIESFEIDDKEDWFIVEKLLQNYG